MIEIIVGVVCLIIGGFGVYIYLNTRDLKKSKNLLLQARKEAEQIKKEKILQAKEKFIELKSEHEKIINKKNNEINNIQQRIKQKEIFWI